MGRPIFGRGVFGVELFDAVCAVGGVVFVFEGCEEGFVVEVVGV